MNKTQYGGKKGVGTDHLIVELLDRIRKAQDDSENLAVIKNSYVWKGAFDQLDPTKVTVKCIKLGIRSSIVRIHNDSQFFRIILSFSYSVKQFNYEVFSSHSLHIVCYSFCSQCPHLLGLIKMIQRFCYNLMLKLLFLFLSLFIYFYCVLELELHTPVFKPWGIFPQ